MLLLTLLMVVNRTIRFTQFCQRVNIAHYAYMPHFFVLLNLFYNSNEKQYNFQKKNEERYPRKLVVVDVFYILELPACLKNYKIRAKPFSNSLWLNVVLSLDE